MSTVNVKALAAIRMARPFALWQLQTHLQCITFKQKSATQKNATIYKIAQQVLERMQHPGALAHDELVSHSRFSLLYLFYPREIFQFSFFSRSF